MSFYFCDSNYTLKNLNLTSSITISEWTSGLWLISEALRGPRPKRGTQLHKNQVRTGPKTPRIKHRKFWKMSVLTEKLAVWEFKRKIWPYFNLFWLFCIDLDTKTIFFIQKIENISENFLVILGNLYINFLELKLQIRKLRNSCR